MTIDWENYSLSLFNKRENDIHGMFALLHEITGQYATRYNITEKNERKGYEAFNLDKYYSENNFYLFSNEDTISFTITFDSPFLLAGYSMCNHRLINDSNSFPKSWNIYGEINGRRYTLDKRTDVSFCEEGKTYCDKENIKTFNTINVYRSQRAVTKIIFEQTENSLNKQYIFLKSFDLYGTLCGKNQLCSFIHFTCESQKRHLKSFFLWISFFSLY